MLCLSHLDANRSHLTPGVDRFFESRCKSRPGEPTTARTNIYTCLCMQANRLKHVHTFLIGYRSGGTPDILRNLRARDGIAGRRRGSNACQRPGDLPALRVARRCSPVGFDQQHTAIRIDLNSAEVCNFTHKQGTATRSP